MRIIFLLFFEIKAMMRRVVPYVLLMALAISATAFASPALAQSAAPMADSTGVPTAIVIQSIGSSTGAIEWVILMQIVAFLVLLTLLMNGTIQDKLRTQWRKKDHNSAELRNPKR